MPQIFQVLKCYKCLLFQIHQTKKSNKWICKVCFEKQSVKRHYGVGTAKDCRIHVQKLNNLRADKEDAKFKESDFENSEYEDDVENIPKINSTGTPQDDNKKLQSKWLPYVETEQVLEVNEPMYLDNKEVFLELPQKRKQKQTTRKQKIAKISSGDESNKILCNSSKGQHQCISEINQYSNDNRNNTFDTGKDLSISQAKKSLENNQPKPLLSVISKGSKWDHFVDTDETIKDESDHKQYDSFETEDQFLETTNEKDDNVDIYKQSEQTTDCHQAKNVTCIDSDGKIQSSINEPLFSLCDDGDLDEILDF